MLRRYSVFVAIFVIGCAPLDRPRPSLGTDSLVDLGTSHLRRGELADAGAAFSLALEIAPTAESLDGLGCVHFLSGNFLEAESYFKKALEADPSYSRAVSNLALLSEVKGESHRAQRLYEDALQREGENFRLRNNFAAFLHDKGKGDEETLHLLRQARALTPHPMIEKNLKRLTGER